jgi:hypothetical protein
MVQLGRRALDDLIDECLWQAWRPRLCRPTGTPHIRQHEAFAYSLPDVAATKIAAPFYHI